MSRFSQLSHRVFMPFWILGDPSPEESLKRIQILVDSGVNALELGIPFSDPIADGPVIQQAAIRALRAGTNLKTCFDLLAEIRQKNPHIPISLLTYANLVLAGGEDAFYANCAQSGVDAVLLADVPTVEATYFCELAMHHGIDPVLIATPNMSEQQMQVIAQKSKGYVYGLTRSGITGADKELRLDAKNWIQKLKNLGAPPVFLGFGISTPDQVVQAFSEGASGVIFGSAIVSTPVQELSGFIRSMILMS